MCDQDDNQYTRQKSSGKGEPKKKKPPIKPFVLRPDEVYSRQYLIEVMSLSKNTFTKWHKRGLRKLNTETAQDLYLGIDLITLFRSPA